MSTATARRAKTRKAPPPRVDLAARAKAARPPTDERGTAGTVGWGGIMSALAADYAPAWQLPRRWTTTENMRADPAVTAALAALTYPLLGATFTVEAASDDPEDVRLAEFVEAGLANMTTDLMTHRMEALDSVGDGVSVFYTRYEEREDGLYHLRKLKLLPNKAITTWHVEEEHGGPDGVSQVLPTGREERFSMDDLLVFTHMRRGDSLHGRPALRAMYRPWFLIDKLSRVGAIAVERGASGTPWARYVGGSDTEAAKLDRALQGLHANERAFFRVDDQVTDWGIKGIEGATVDPVPMMEFQRRDLFLAPLAQFLALGTDGVGSMALSGDHSSFFILALQFIAREIEDTYNRYLIPRWIGYNWTVAADRLPRVKHGPLDRRDVGAWTQSVAAMVQAGVPLPMEALAEEATRMLGITVPEAQAAPGAADVADVNDPNAPASGEGGEVVDQRARGTWTGVGLAAMHPFPVCVDCGEPITFAGKPCGGSFIEAGKTCRIGGARAFTDAQDFADYFAKSGTTKASPSQRKAVEAYGADGYKSVNASLREGKKPSAKDAKVIAEMDGYMKSAKPLDEDVVVFRGGALPSGLRVGTEFSDAGFGSTSGDVDVATRFAGTGKPIMQIKIPKGAKALPFGAAMGGGDFESELIVPRGTRYRVTGMGKMKRRVSYRKFPSGTGTKTVTIPTVEIEVLP